MLLRQGRENPIQALLMLRRAAVAPRIAAAARVALREILSAPAAAGEPSQSAPPISKQGRLPRAPRVHQPQDEPNRHDDHRAGEQYAPEMAQIDQSEIDDMAN